jgi:putative tryptophan/tyrosine transport system substrate-binding protein
MSRVAVLWDMNAPGPALALKEYETIAPALKVQLQSLGVHGPNPDLEGALQAAVQGNASALITIGSSLISRYSKRIADLAVKYRLPAMCDAFEYLEAGGLVSYLAREEERYRRAATYVDKILKGTKPADLPVEQPTKFELVINLKTAKQIGLTIPPNVLARADRVIK